MRDHQIRTRCATDAHVTGLSGLPGLYGQLASLSRWEYSRVGGNGLPHAYLLGVESLADLKEVFLDKVIPLLQEYFYGDGEKVCAILG